MRVLDIGAVHHQLDLIPLSGIFLTGQKLCCMSIPLLDVKFGSSLSPLDLMSGCDSGGFFCFFVYSRLLVEEVLIYCMLTVLHLNPRHLAIRQMKDLSLANQKA